MLQGPVSHRPPLNVSEIQGQRMPSLSPMLVACGLIQHQGRGPPVWGRGQAHAHSWDRAWVATNPSVEAPRPADTPLVCW